MMIIETVNLHVWPSCTLRCDYCFGQFPRIAKSLNTNAWLEVLEELKRCGVIRVSFSGGEPTLHPGLLSMLRYARDLGLQTSLVTNGARLTDEIVKCLDLLGMNVDSIHPETLLRLGRRGPDDEPWLDTVRRAFDRGRAANPNLRLKVNTVVNAINAHEDMTDELRRLRPEKWKLLQFTRVAGENDRATQRLEISKVTFDAFVNRQLRRASRDTLITVESEVQVQETYVMIDPSGRVFRNSAGNNRQSRPLLQVGLVAALRDVGGYDRAGFVARGGAFDVRRLPVFQGIAP